MARGSNPSRPPRVDWWECPECDVMFCSKTDPRRPASEDSTTDCPTCDEPCVLVAGGVPLWKP